MAIVETHSPDTFEGMVSGSDAWGLVGGKPSKWQVASFLVLDVAPLFTPLAFVSGIRKASYIRKLIQAEKASDLKFGVAAREAALGMPVRTGLFVTAMVPGTMAMANPAVWNALRISGDIAEDVVIFHMDREGKDCVVHSK